MKQIKFWKKKTGNKTSPVYPRCQVPAPKKIVKAVLVGGPCAGGYSQEPFQDVLVMPYGTPPYGDGGPARETLSIEGKCFAVYRRRLDGRYYYTGSLTADYLRRHQDFDREAPMKIEHPLEVSPKMNPSLKLG